MDVAQQEGEISFLAPPVPLERDADSVCGPSALGLGMPGMTWSSSMTREC